jgi:hypothetical protein
MDLPYVIVVAASSALVLTSATIIAIVNFRRICGCCVRREPNIETVTNPVNEWK